MHLPGRRRPPADHGIVTDEEAIFQRNSYVANLTTLQEINGQLSVGSYGPCQQRVHLFLQGGGFLINSGGVILVVALQQLEVGSVAR